MAIHGKPEVLTTPDPSTDYRQAATDCQVGMERSCARCVYAGTVEDLAGVLVCVNHPQAQGRMKRVWPQDGCRSFRAKRRPRGPAGAELRYLALSRGRFAIVAAADYHRLSRHKWSLVGHGDKFYARRTARGTHILMHREIMQPPADMVVDHSDGNGLNNYRASLRICTARENQQNRRPRRGASSRYKGVWHDPRSHKWVAGLGIDGEPRRLGVFDDERAAARAYDCQALAAFGAYAYLNFPEEHPPAVGSPQGPVRRHHVPPPYGRPPPPGPSVLRRQPR